MYLPDMSGIMARKTGKLSSGRTSVNQRFYTSVCGGVSLILVLLKMPVLFLSYVYVCAQVQVPEEPRRGTGYPGAGFTDS